MGILSQAVGPPISPRCLSNLELTPLSSFSPTLVSPSVFCGPDHKLVGFKRARHLAKPHSGASCGILPHLPRGVGSHRPRGPGLGRTHLGFSLHLLSIQCRPPPTNWTVTYGASFASPPPGLRRRDTVASRGPSPLRKTSSVQGTPPDSGEHAVPLSHCPIYPTSSLKQFGPFPPWTLQFFFDPEWLCLPSTCLKKPEFECSREGPESGDDGMAGFLLGQALRGGYDLAFRLFSNCTLSDANPTLYGRSALCLREEALLAMAATEPALLPVFGCYLWKCDAPQESKLAAYQRYFYLRFKMHHDCAPWDKIPLRHFTCSCTAIGFI